MFISKNFSVQENVSILTFAFHKDVKNFDQAEKKLAGHRIGTFLTYSIGEQNFCSAVREDGRISHKPFRWDVSGGWYNGSPTRYETDMDLLTHLAGDNASALCS